MLDFKNKSAITVCRKFGLITKNKSIKDGYTKT